jgi:outer membrane protein, adhesin transport system
MTSIAFHSRKKLLPRIPTSVTRFGGAALLLGCLSWPVHAADVSLKQLLEIAVVKHPSVLQARSQAQAAGFDLEAAQWGRYPTVSSELRSDTNLTPSLAKVEQPLWTGGMQAAASRKDAVQQELETLDRNLQSQTQSAISELDALQAQLKPAKALLDGTAEVVDSYLRQYQVGRKNWLDVLNAQREKTQALYNLADMQYGHQLAQVRLMILSGDISAQQLAALHD